MILKSPIIQGKYYSKGQLLGTGSYGQVIKARNFRQGKEVAIKFIKFPEEKVCYAQKGLENQVRALEMLAGKKNIVQLYEKLLNSQNKMLVLEYCETGTLRKYLCESLISRSEAYRIMRQIVQGCKQIHTKGLIHRDLKPQNILLTGKKAIRVIDYNFAIFQEQALEEKHIKVGTTNYMAPEVILRNQYSQKCDVWALGIIFYEILTGLIFWEHHDQKKFLKNKAVKIQKHSKIMEQDISIIQNILQYDPSKRPTTSDLLNLLAEEELKKSVQTTKTSSSETINSFESQELINEMFSLMKLSGLLKRTIVNFPSLNIDIPIALYDKIIKLLHKKQSQKKEILTSLSFLSKSERTFYMKQNEYSVLLKNIKQWESQDIFIPEQNRYKMGKNMEKDLGVIDGMLQWVSEYIHKESPYILFVVFDYLITYRWLEAIRVSDEGIKKIFESVKVSSIEAAFSRQIRANKKIEEMLLSQLRKKLKLLLVMHS